MLRLEVISPDPVEVTDPVTAGPDRIRLGLEQDGEFTVLAELDGRYLSTEVTGGFTGRVIGVYAAAGTASFDWFDYEVLPGERGRLGRRRRFVANLFGGTRL